MQKGPLSHFRLLGILTDSCGGFFAESRLSATLNRKGGDLSRPPLLHAFTSLGGGGPFAKGPPPPNPFPPKPWGEGLLGKSREQLYSDCSRSFSYVPQPSPKVLEGWGSGGGEPFSKGSAPPQRPPPRNPDGFLRGLFAESRLSATSNRKGGSLSRPPHPAVLPQAAKPLIGQNAPFTPPRFVNYKKIGGTAALFLPPFPFYSPHPFPQSFRRVGARGRGTFLKRFPSPAYLSPAKNPADCLRPGLRSLQKESPLPPASPAGCDTWHSRCRPASSGSRDCPSQQCGHAPAG